MICKMKRDGERERDTEREREREREIGRVKKERHDLKGVRDII